MDGGQSFSIQEEIETIFSKQDTSCPLAREQFATSFKNLAFFCLRKHDIEDCALTFDEYGIIELFHRFQRDAFGVMKYWDYLQTLEQTRENPITSGVRKGLWKKLKSLGIRLNSEKPRKTRVAACFALWAATFRPVHACYSVDAPDFKKERARKFCADMIFFVCNRYLRQFGTLEMGSNDLDKAIRKDHIIHDFLYRQLSHSTLELLFCSIFRARREHCQRSESCSSGGLKL